MFLHALTLIGNTLRLSAGTVLAVFEPVVRLVLSSLSLLGCSMAAFFALTQTAHNAPILGMLLVSTSSLLILRVYYDLMRWLR